MMIARIRNGAMFALATVAGALPALGFAPSIAAEQSPVGAYSGTQTRGVHRRIRTAAIWSRT